jgi:hypothetical protein
MTREANHSSSATTNEVLVSSHLISSKINCAYRSDNPSLNMCTYLSKSVATKGPSHDRPSFFINKFCAAATAGARWKAFFTSRVIWHGRDARAGAFFLLLGGGVDKAESTTGFDSTHTNNVRLDGICPQSSVLDQLLTSC